MNKIIILLMLISISTAYAQKVSKKLVNTEIETSHFMGYANLGVSQPETTSRHDLKDYGKRLVTHFELGARYSLIEKLSFNLEVGKLMSSSQFSDNSGSLSYIINAGFNFALTGSLSRNIETKTYLFQRKDNFANKTRIITQTRKITTKKETDGFRLGLYASQLEFSKLDNPSYGVTTSLFYEQRILKNNLIQYGLKYTAVESTKVKAQLMQLFVGFGFSQ